MAELLKRENDILTLKIELVDQARVRCTLQFLVDMRLESLPQWQGPLADFGFPEGARSLSPRSQDAARWHLPAALVQGLRAWMLGNTDGTRPLWVHLVKPYGALRYLPWERLLGDAVGVPVLMLPDFIFPPPRESVSLLDIAICASAPLDCEDGWIRDGLANTVAALREALGGEARLHLFTDTVMQAALRDTFPENDALLWHPQADAAPFVAEDLSSRLHDASGTLRSPWLLWMRERLRPYATDIVHFVGHGHLSRDRGALLFAQSPLERTDRYLAGPVGSVELSNFLAQVGAWATGFSSPVDNHDPVGLRVLADEIAQSLPGPMLLFNREHAADPVGELAAAYRFVFSAQPQPPPRSRAVFLYCQPYLLDEARDLDRARVASDGLAAQLQVLARSDRHREAALSALSGGQAHEARSGGAGRTVSALTAATERLAEQVGLDYQQAVRDAVVPAEVARDGMDVAMRTVERLRGLAHALERERIRGEIDASVREIERLAGPSTREAVRVLPGVDLPGAHGSASQPVPPDPGHAIDRKLRTIEDLSTQLRHVEGGDGGLELVVETRLQRALAPLLSRQLDARGQEGVGE